MKRIHLRFEVINLSGTSQHRMVFFSVKHYLIAEKNTIFSYYIGHVKLAEFCLIPIIICQESKIKTEGSDGYS